MSSNTSRKSKKEKATLFFWNEGYFDYQTLFITVVLVLFGIMMVYSASSYRAVMEGNNDFHYALRQAIISAAGFVLLFVASGINYKKYLNLSVIAMVATVGLCGLVLIIGIASHGATRWIDLGFFQLQPSELLKPAIILFVARLCATEEALLDDMAGIVKVLALPIVGIVLVAGENLSTAVVCFGIAVVMIFVAARNIKPIVLMTLVGAGVAVLYIVFVGYRGDRIKAWLDPASTDEGYQILQSLYAIGSGGLFGKGLGNSIQKTGFLPESHNDMIFSVICEELGLFGALAVLTLFIMLLFRLKYIADNSPNKFAAFIVTGVLAHIAIQLIINIGVVTKTIPPTGVTLPFISYGGTSVVAMLVEVGLVLSVSRQIKPYEK